MAERRRAVGEGSLYYDESKERWVGALMVDGKRRKVVGRTKTQARERLDDLRRRTLAGEQVGDGNATVADAITRWRERVLPARDLAPATRETYAWCADRITTELGTKRLRTLRVEDVEDALDRIANGGAAGKPCSRATLVKVRSVLGQVLDFAQRRGMVARNVARHAELTPKAPRRTRERRALTAKETRKLLRVLGDDPVDLLLRLIVATGMRPGEAGALTWADVDLDRGTVNVTHGVQRVHGKPMLSDDLKTERSRRTLDVDDAMVAALRKHKKAQAARRLRAERWADERLVFASRNGTLLMPRVLTATLARQCEKAGIPVVTPNELRHTAASLMSDDGTPLEVIADQLGHVNTRMLGQTYRHRLRPTVSAGKESMERLQAKR